MTDMQDDNFYEDDEPVTEVLAAFDRGQQGFTALPDATYWLLNSRQTTFSASTSVFRTPLSEAPAPTLMEPLAR